LGGARSGLWHQFHRILGEFRPGICVIENVPGLYSANGGLDFLTVIRGLAQLGYCIAWGVLDSEYFHVPQRRERPFIIGSLGTGSAAQILFEPESVRGDSPPSRKTGQNVAGTIRARSTAGGGLGDFEYDGGLVPEKARCLNSGRDGYNDGSDQTYICGTLNAHSKRHGHAMTTQQSAESNQLVVAPVASSIRTKTGRSDDRGDGCDNLIAFGCKDHGQDAQEDCAPTLRSMNHVDGNSNGGGQVAVAFQTRIGRNGRGQPEPIAPALSGADCGATSDMRPCVATGTAVRRLTPRECERLQGFEDDWTRWDADGKQISDSARYRMLGNAVTTHVSEWIGRQIMRVDCPR
jgi:DNA (cytosine-5)-methyltransferase 1